jgi:hypothetical protein
VHFSIRLSRLTGAFANRLPPIDAAAPTCDGGRIAP